MVTQPPIVNSSVSPSVTVAASPVLGYVRDSGICLGESAKWALLTMCVGGALATLLFVSYVVQKVSEIYPVVPQKLVVRNNRPTLDIMDIGNNILALDPSRAHIQ